MSGQQFKIHETQINYMFMYVCDCMQGYLIDAGFLDGGPGEENLQ